MVIITSPGGLSGRVSIEQRPEVVSKRTHLGDLEIDHVIPLNKEPAIVFNNVQHHLSG